jgi:hypothetical protein
MNRLTENTTFTVPAKHNPHLQQVVDRINADEELRQWWRCANVNAVDRLGLSDHGEVHNRIVANASLRLLRLLREAGHPASLTVHHRLPPEEAEVVVVLAAALHDLGIAVHYDHHADYSLPLAYSKAKELLQGLYPPREQTVIVSEILHAIAAHHGWSSCLTLEAGILKLADALDMTTGRIRPLTAQTAPSSGSAGEGNDVPVTEVTIKKGESKLIRVALKMSRPSALAQVEEMLQHRLQGSPLFGLVEVVVSIPELEVA